MADKISINSKFDLDGNYEMSDSDTENTEKEKSTLKRLQKQNEGEGDSSSEEDVYAFSESDNESENDIGMADSDVEGQENSDDDLPDSKAWGNKKRSYYSTDYVDQDYGGFGQEEEAALMEEEEAKNIQKRLIEQLEEDDFKLDFISPLQPIDDKKETVIKSDLSQMSKREKMQILEKESPEFAGLIEDFKSKLSVAKDDLQPVLKLIKGGTLPECMAAKFIKSNYNLILNYCTNISFYILLKSQRINIQNHPVVKRLYQYRQMLNKMEPIYIEVVKPQIEKILTASQNNIKLKVIEKYMKRKLNKGSSDQPSKKLKLINNLDKDEEEDTGVSDEESDFDGNDYFKSGNEMLNTNGSEESGFSDNEDADIKNNQKPTLQTDNIIEESGVKREITYQIAKNKGLTPHRKKEQRNPRVKHKLKYRKAKIRRKGAIREPRTEVNRYAGEASGIKTNVKKSIKIK